jgi:hypothetical protein
VKVGSLVFVSGTPGFKDEKLASGDFSAQMKQAMETRQQSGSSSSRFKEHEQAVLMDSTNYAPKAQAFFE